MNTCYPLGIVLIGVIIFALEYAHKNMGVPKYGKSMTPDQRERIQDKIRKGRNQETIIINFMEKPDPVIGLFVDKDPTENGLMNYELQPLKRKLMNQQTFPFNEPVNERLAVKGEFSPKSGDGEKIPFILYADSRAFPLVRQYENENIRLQKKVLRLEEEVDISRHILDLPYDRATFLEMFRKTAELESLKKGKDDSGKVSLETSPRGEAEK